MSWIEVTPRRPAARRRPTRPRAAPRGRAASRDTPRAAAAGPQPAAWRAARRSHAPIPGALGRLDRHDLARRRRAAPRRARRCRGRAARPPARSPARRPRVLGGDQVLVGREPHVADVDAAEQPVPVAVVRLARGGGGRPPRRAPGPAGIAATFVGGAQHLLVEVVDLAVLDLEVAPEPAAQPARRRVMPGDGVVEQPREHGGLVGRQRPLAHLGIRAGRDVDAADRGLALQPLRRRHGRQPVAVRLERLEEPLDPAAARPSSARRSWARRRTSRRRRPSSRPALPSSVAWSRR